MNEDGHCQHMDDDHQPDQGGAVYSLVYTLIFDLGAYLRNDQKPRKSAGFAAVRGLVRTSN